MRRASAFFCLCSALVLASHSALGQATQADRLQFEVASVRRAAPGIRFDGMKGGPGTSDPGRMTWTNSTLLGIFIYAYGIRFDQLSAPDWLRSARYDISAKVPPGTTPERSRQMLRNLLGERFHLVAHHETKDFPAYNLVIYKRKPKLTPSSAEDIAAHASSEVPPGMRVSPRQSSLIITGADGAFTMRGEAATLSGLAGSLRASLGRRIVDRTGLTGYFDFGLAFSQSLDSQSDAAPSILDALREQLGLDLQETKLAIDVVVVDRVDRTPTAN